MVDLMAMTRCMGIQHGKIFRENKNGFCSPDPDVYVVPNVTSH
jgi:hypothetical protein